MTLTAILAKSPLNAKPNNVEIKNNIQTTKIRNSQIRSQGADQIIQITKPDCRTSQVDLHMMMLPDQFFKEVWSLIVKEKKRKEK